MEGPERGSRRAPWRLAGPVLCFVLGACLRVPPAPLDLPAHVAARTGAQADPARWAALRARLAPAGTAAPGGIDRLTLLAAILADDPRVMAARRAVEAARRDALAAHKAAMPSLTLGTEYANDPSASSAWLGSAALALPLDTGGRRSGRIATADLALVAARLDLAETIWAERGAARRALIDVMAGTRQAALGGSLVAMLDRQIAAMAARAAAGEIAPLMLGPVRAQRAAAARARDDAVARADGGRAALAGVLGLPAVALGPMSFVWDGFDTPVAPEVDGGQVRAALAARADVLKAMTAYDTAEATLRIAVASQYPAITLGPGYTWDHGVVRWPFSLGLQIPSFDANHAAIRAALAHRAAAAAAVDGALADAAAAVGTARNEGAAAARALDRQRREEVSQATLAATRADVQLRLGAIGRADWAALKAADVAAQLGAVDALTRVWQAQAALEDALRRPLDGPEARLGRLPLDLDGETRP